ncbi:MAG: type I-U CRISPR-associated protein Csb2 [Desertifilum sp.]|nr:type I-U CRISPR-associated protein Csb2 [Desertifilum sp.]
MSVGLSIQFLAGRYHATPWDRQVNEGVVEWPPSPWRILRALVSAYYRLPDRPGVEVMRRLVAHLASELPCYDLPEAIATHTRHYMPIWKEGKATTTKVFDTFLVLAGGTLSPQAKIQVLWPTVELDAEERELLAQLCLQVSYLGRAESWVELQLTSVEPNQCKTVPMKSEQAHPGEVARVLVPLSPEEFKGFQTAIAMLPKPKRKRSQWQVPANLLEALSLDIGQLHAQGWNGIPGARWAMYAIPKAQPQRRERVSPSRSIKANFARYAIVCNVPVKLTEALSLGERFRQALMSRSQVDNIPDPIFSGRDANEKPLINHQHAWYLPEDTDGDGKIDAVVVYARQGFSERAIAALQSLHQVWGRDRFKVQTLLTSFGDVEDYRASVEDVRGRSLVVGCGTVWQNITPMVLPRHAHYSASGEPKINPETGLPKDGPEDQVRWLLKQLGFPYTQEAVEVKPPPDEERRVFAWHQFQRRRTQGQGSKSSDRGYWFRLTFKEPQKGPIALGYAAHFGLGTFIPINLDR